MRLSERDKNLLYKIISERVIISIKKDGQELGFDEQEYEDDSEV